MDIEISRDICNFIQNLIQRNCSTRPVFLTDRRIKDDKRQRCFVSFSARNRSKTSLSLSVLPAHPYHQHLYVICDRSSQIRMASLCLLLRTARRIHLYVYPVLHRQTQPSAVFLNLKDSAPHTLSLHLSCSQARLQGYRAD